MINIEFFILFSFMVAFISTLGVFPNVSSEQYTTKSMNLGEGIRELCLTNDLRIWH